MACLCIYKSFEVIWDPQPCANIPFVRRPPPLNRRGAHTESRAHERLAWRRGSGRGNLLPRKGRRRVKP